MDRHDELTRRGDLRFIIFLETEADKKVGECKSRGVKSTEFMNLVILVPNHIHYKEGSKFQLHFVSRREKDRNNLCSSFISLSMIASLFFPSNL